MPPDLRLGSHRHDLTHRVLVMATLDRELGEAALLQAADRAVAAGADILAVVRSPDRVGAPMGEDEEIDGTVEAVEALAPRFALPVAVETERPEFLRAAAKAGALVAEDTSGFADPAYLPAAVDLGLTVIAHTAVAADPVSAYTRATSAGLRPDEVVLTAALAQVRLVAAAGHPVMVPAVAGDPVAALAVAALAVTRGARLVHTADLAATVNVVRMLERILSA
jgi:dihydropteroate synthase